MREILFRGKRTDNGDWVHGDLSHHRDGRVFIRCWERLELDPAYNAFEVNPETVGQFTGLTENGKKAFEHDITEDGWGRRWVIFACDGGFGIRRNSEWLRNDPIYNALADAQNAAWFKDNHTIIGNIHDNPELLEVGVDG